MSITRYSCIQSEWTKTSWREWKWSSFETIANEWFEPGLSRLRVRHCTYRAPQWQLNWTFSSSNHTENFDVYHIHICTYSIIYTKTTLTHIKYIVHGSRTKNDSNRASDFPRSRKSRGIRGIADLKRNPWNSKKKKKKNFFFFFLDVSHTWLLALFCPFCCLHTALIVPCLFYCPFTC